MACSSCSKSKAISIPIRSMRGTALPAPIQPIPQHTVSVYNLSGKSKTNKQTISIKSANDAEKRRA